MAASASEDSGWVEREVELQVVNEPDGTVRRLLHQSARRIHAHGIRSIRYAERPNVPLTVSCRPVTVRCCRSLVCPRVETNLHHSAVTNSRLTCCFTWA
jgi:hypothetical protein